MQIWKFFEHITGLDNASGLWYLWWSGFAGDLGIFAAIMIGLRHLNCHQHGCIRLGRHQIDGTPFRVCRKHHPDIP